MERKIILNFRSRIHLNDRSNGSLATGKSNFRSKLETNPLKHTACNALYTLLTQPLSFRIHGRTGLN